MHATKLHHDLRAIDYDKEPEKAAKEMKRHDEYHSNDLDEDVLEMRKAESWNELFDSRLWEDGRFERYAGGENCSWILGLTPSITLEQLVNVEFLDSAGDAVIRESGERLTLYGRHQGMTILHFDHEGLTRHTKGTFALSPHGHMLPKIRRDARKDIVTKKFSGERSFGTIQKKQLTQNCNQFAHNVALKETLLLNLKDS